MNPHGKTFSLPLILIALLLLAAGRPVCSRELLPEDFPSAKNMLRQHDPVVVSGDLLSDFHGFDIIDFRLYAYSDNQFHIIPFQIDERDPEGEFVFTGGDAAGMDIDGGQFDYNDEIVFMIKDAGGEAPQNQWPPAGSLGAEIVIIDPKDAVQKAWVYLIFSPGTSSPLSGKDYITYIPKQEKVTSAYYGMRYMKGAPFYMDLSYPPSAGGSGEDFFDRIKVRLSVNAFFDLLHIQKTEEDFRSVVVGWKDGPVRAMRKVENYFRILFNLSSPSIFSVNEYYERMTYTPVQLTIPFKLKWVFNSFGVNDWTWTIYGDFPGLKGGLAYTDRNVKGFQFTGNHSPEYLNEHIDLSRFSWGYNTKPGVGTWFPNLLLPEMLYGIVTLHIVDDETLPDPPEDTPGLIAAGMEGRWKYFHPDLVDLLEPGTYELSMDTYFPHPSIRIEEVEEWLQIRQFPLWVEISDVRVNQFVPPSSAVQKHRNEIGKPRPVDEDTGFRGMITDTRGREFVLTDIFFYAGSYRVTPRTNILGRLFSENTYTLMKFDDIRQITHRYEEMDPVSHMQNPMVQELLLRKGETVQMLGCKPCGFTGRLPDGKKIFLWDTQIRSVRFDE
ncbi:MAG: hypothetical protein C4522_04905 [Desulfobacteraceae bacterium]|nr:MAG: hypothetical protein C4522_04905 [Desulfobacteraceae bacterium]